MKVSSIVKEEFQNKNRIIIKKDVFEDSNNFIPDEILHRDDQIRILVQILKDAERGDKPNNIFIYGKPGTGKTLCAQSVVKEILKFNNRIHAIYCNINGIKTTFALVQKLTNLLYGDKIKGRGTSLAHAYEVMWSNFNTLEGVLIIVLDEIDYLDTSDVLYSILRFQNENLNKLKISIIGISNSITFTQRLDPRVLSSLGEENIIFPIYHAGEIRDIIQKRAEQGFINGINCLDQAVMPLCAAIATQQAGDARFAIQLLKTAALIAERERLELVSEKHVHEAKIKIERDHTIELILDLPLQSKTVLISIIFLNNKGKNKPSTTEIYKEYSDLSRHIDLDILTHRRISDIISEMAMMDIVDVELSYKGRYGRSNKYRLLIDENIILKKLHEDYRFKQIIDNNIKAGSQQKSL